jgi:carboxypeptidase C (cathepsin A)
MRFGTVFSPSSTFSGLLASVLLAVSLSAQEPGPPPAGTEPRWVRSHPVAVEGQEVEYDAVVASIAQAHEDGEPADELFYTGHLRTDTPDAGSRPIVFAYNGGPGSASFRLHMGIMGLRRVVTPEVGPDVAEAMLRNPEMYVEESLLPQWRTRLADFARRTSGGSGMASDR